MSAPNNPLKRTADDLEQKWVSEEDGFVLNQSKKKALIRIKANRPQTIDWLTVTVIVIDPEHNKVDDEIDIEELELRDPKDVVYALDIKGLNDLIRDIETFITLEKSRSNQEYWQVVKQACKDRKEELEPTKATFRDVENVVDKMDAIFAKKDYDGLLALEVRVRDKMANDPNLDMDYWNGLLDRMQLAKTRVKLASIAENFHKAHKGPIVEASQAQAPSKTTSANGSSSRFVKEGGAAFEYGDGGQNNTANTASPQIVAKKPRIEVPNAPSAATAALLQRERARGMAEGEEPFAAEAAVSVNKSQASWANKYRPRKPLYFNRVHMGYEWNKYNQTHYDHDNPPPKIVQGYKFNIFYPDLIDVMKTPTFKIERENGRRKGESTAPAGEDDTCIIRFIGGPPYEDIAFRIVDKEWDYSAKSDRGYKSIFDKVF